MHAFTKKVLLSAAAAATLAGAYITFAQASPTASSPTVSITNQSNSITIVSDGFPKVLPNATETFAQPSAGTVVQYRSANNAKEGCNFYFQTGPKGEMMITSKVATSSQAQCSVAYGMHLAVNVSS